MVVGAAAAGIGAGGAGVLVVGCGVFCNAAGFDCAGGISAGEGDAGAVVCCAIVLNPSSREAVSVHFQVRMTKSSLSRLIRQLENHMHNRRRIDRLVIMLGRLEPD
jgi:cyanophycinase-like exopeptidase